ncbi:MAG: hypothetical protein JWP04_700 [Belnapia sp.]|nr:hypothetical protein [Belnapia sp.]
MSDTTDFAGFLRTHPGFGRINFKYLTYQVYPQGYAKDVAGCVAAGRIRINRRFSDLGFAGTGAAYIMDSDQYSLSKGFDLTKPAAQILIVHESTHALQDFQNLGKIPVPDAEAIAYVAEAIFALAIGRPPLVDPATGAPHPIRVAAANAAAAVMAGAYEVGQAMVAAVRTAVAHSGHYDAKGFHDFDGIEDRSLGATLRFVGGRMHD